MTSAENRRGEGRGQQQYSSSSGAAVLRQAGPHHQLHTLCVEVSSDDKDPILQKGALLRYLHLRRLVKVPQNNPSPAAIALGAWHEAEVVRRITP